MEPETALRQVSTLLEQGRTREAQEIAEFAIAEADERRRVQQRDWIRDIDIANVELRG